MLFSNKKRPKNYSIRLSSSSMMARDKTVAQRQVWQNVLPGTLLISLASAAFVGLAEDEVLFKNRP